MWRDKNPLKLRNWTKYQVFFFKSQIRGTDNSCGPIDALLCPNFKWNPLVNGRINPQGLVNAPVRKDNHQRDKLREHKTRAKKLLQNISQGTDDYEKEILRDWTTEQVGLKVA